MFLAGSHEPAGSRAVLDKLKKNKEEEVDTRSPEEIRKDEKRARIRARIKAFERGQIQKKVKYVYLAVLILVVDQITKWYVMEHVMRPLARMPATEGMGFFDWMLSPPPVFFMREALQVTPFFNFVLVWNTGISFGLLGNFSVYGYIILIVISLIIIGFFCLWAYEAKTQEYMIPYAMVVGGALGNVIDRVRFQAVIDFLDFHAMGTHFPAFNVADMAVVSGIGLIIIISQVKTVNRKKRWRKAAHERRNKKYRYGTTGRK